MEMLMWPIVLVGLLVTPAHLVTLQLSSPQDRTTALYRAPATYQEPGRPARNSVIITSQPVHIGHQIQTQSSSTRPVSQPSPSWRRQLFVSTSLGADGATGIPSIHLTTNSTALGVGASGDPSVVAIDCADGRSCSTTIPVRPPASTHTPTFKPYSQEVLDKLLSDYATVTTSEVKSEQVLYNDQTPIPTTIKSASQDGTELEPTNRLANLYLEEPEDKDNSTDKSKSVQWSLMKAQHHNHPYDDHQGWVTLEPVPWSSSHVSKWQSNVQPSSRPWDNPPQGNHPYNDGGHQRPGPGYPQHSPAYHHNQNTINVNGNGNWPSQEGGNRPWDQHSAASTSWDRPIRPENRPPSRPNRPWEDSRPNKWDRPNSHDHRPGDEQYLSAGHPDIITDNSPPDFPTHNNNPPHRPAGSPSPSYAYGPSHNQLHNSRPWDERPYREPGRHPPTHPSEGDGTWVLLSSTKGYAGPPGRGGHQRALTVSTHRSVRLTVLPPENGTNLTTSHGGLLEVEDTEHTVDESQRLHAASLLRQALDQHHNATVKSYEALVQEAGTLKQLLADRRLANVSSVSDEVPQIAQRPSNATRASKIKRTRVKPHPLQVSDPNASFTGRGDGSAMAVKLVRPSVPGQRSAALAAVGAGLLPATMAMLVPIMLGKRRRRRNIPDSELKTPISSRSRFSQ